MSGQLFIGTSGWHYASWLGPFYPERHPKPKMLAFYVGVFGATEINLSFYRQPTPEAVAAWRESTPEGFLFAWKVSRVITHLKRLKDVEENIAFVLGRAGGLGPKLGPLLVQLPPSLRADRDRLGTFLGLLPKDRRFTFEFRHPSWFEPPILDVLRDYDASLCLSDHAAAPAPFEATASFVYIRGHGPDGRYAGSYTDEALAQWSADIARWRGEGRDVYVYFDNDVKSAAPEDADRLIALTGHT